ncbi:hypothetical protein [Viscerimonas tarda]
MKSIKFILVATTIMCSVTSCHAQEEKKVTDKEFQTLLDRFRTVMPPLNYKKIQQQISSMTEEEAIRFLHKTEDDLYYIEQVMGEDEMGNEILDETTEENIPSCDFKYLLNDSIYILCTREGIYGGEKDTGLVYLRTFTLEGEILDKCVVGGDVTYGDIQVVEEYSSFVLLDIQTVRVFYYAENYTRKDEGFQSTVYYVNYQITDEGKFIRKDKSNITYLKRFVGEYGNYGAYKPKPDDPMSEYDF